LVKSSKLIGREAPSITSRCVRYRWCIAASLLTLASLFLACAAAAEPDTEGIEETTAEFSRFKLGGYLTLRVRDLDDETARFDVRDASLFATWMPGSRWQIFTEIELENGITIDDDGINSSDAELAVERLYADYFAHPTVTLRIGKFLTPIGRWNEIHADPLVWTVSRPLVTSLPFGNHASGLAVRGTIGQPDGTSLDYVAYVDYGEALDPSHEESTSEDIEFPGFTNVFDNAIGGQIRYHFWNERAEIGLSLADFDVKDQSERKHLVGVDGRLLWHGAEITSELIYRASSGREESEFGAYVQAVVPLIEQWYGVARYEHYDGALQATRANLTTLALAYRPRPPLVFKLEYRTGDDNDSVAANGVLASFGILF
jgi:hypothetical protein